MVSFVLPSTPMFFAGIASGFDWLITTIGSIINLVVSLIKGLLRLISLIPTAVEVLSLSIGVLPSLLVAFASVTITVSVIFILVGRDQGGGSK